MKLKTEKVWIARVTGQNGIYAFIDVLLKTFAMKVFTLLLAGFVSIGCCFARQGELEYLGRIGNKLFYKGDDSVSWFGASMNCSMKLMQLASIQTAEENNFLLAHSSVGLYVSYWLGSVVTNTDNDMLWHYSGTQVDFFEPTIYGSFSVVFDRLNRNWRVVPIDMENSENWHPFFCERRIIGAERDLAGNLSQVAGWRPTGRDRRTVIKSTSPVGTLDLQLLGQVGTKEYYVDLLGQLTWNESLHSCEGLGMQLAEVLQLEEKNFLRNHPLLSEIRFWLAGRIFTNATELTWGNNPNMPIDLDMGQINPAAVFHRYSIVFEGREWAEFTFEVESIQMPYVCQKIVENTVRKVM